MEEFGTPDSGDVMLKFDLYDKRDFKDCLNLIRTGHDLDFPESRFRWLHEQGPAGPSQIAVCKQDNQVVGIYSVLPKIVHFGGMEYCGGRDIDPVVHPSFRGQGIFSRLLQFGLENFQGLDFFFNFANSASARGFLRQGWRHVMALEDRVCQLGFSSPFSRAGLLWTLCAFNRPTPDQLQTRSLGTSEFRDLLKNDPRFKNIGESTERGGVCRSRQYLTWRYLDHPLNKYNYFLAEGESDDVSVVVTNYDKGMDRLTIIDLAGCRGSTRLGTWLPLWRKQFPHATVIAWHTLPKSTLGGFLGNPLQRRKGQSFLVREFPGGNIPDGLFDDKNWLLTRGDLEIT